MVGVDLIESAEGVVAVVVVVVPVALGCRGHAERGVVQRFGAGVGCWGVGSGPWGRRWAAGASERQVSG